MKPQVGVTTPPCMHCGKQSEIWVDNEALGKWIKRELLIQDAFPELTYDQRELLKTGTHPQCWIAMFGDDDE